MMIASLVRLIAFAGLLVSFSLLIEMRRARIPQENGGTARKPSWAVAALLISLAGIVVSGIGLSDHGPVMPIPFLLLVPLPPGIAPSGPPERSASPPSPIHAITPST